MGHINALGDSVSAAHELADRALQKLSGNGSEQAA